MQFISIKACNVCLKMMGIDLIDTLVIVETHLFKDVLFHTNIA